MFFCLFNILRILYKLFKYWHNKATILQYSDDFPCCQLNSGLIHMHLSNKATDTPVYK